MSEQLKNSVQAVRHFWAGSTKKTKKTLALAGVLVVLLAVALAVFMNRTRYTVLYANLDLGEAQEVAAELNRQGIAFRQEGGTIYIPEDVENMVRMDLSGKGYPATAPGYDFFTQNIDLMTTDYEKRIIEKYQMNQRLEAVIKTFDAVKNASVTINLADGSGYAWDERASAQSTAAVALTFHSGKTLDGSQVEAVKRLVSTSVPNLTAENVAVIDTATSRELQSSAAPGGSAISLGEFRLAIEREYQQNIEDGIYGVLEPLYGRENVKVIAKAVMDIDKKVKEMVTYLPAQENTGIISREESQVSSRRDGAAAPGAAGEESNTETAYTGVTTDGDTLYMDDSRVYEYLVSQVTERIESDAAAVSDMTVAVVINKPGMSEAETAEVARLAAYSAAIAPEKVAVHGSAFYGVEIEPELPQAPPQPAPWMRYAAMGGGGLILLLILIVVFLALRLRRRRRQAEEDEIEYEADEYSAQLAAMRSAINDTDATEKLRLMEELHSRNQSSEEQFRRSLQDFSNQNPEIVAQIIKSWIRGEEFDG